MDVVQAITLVLVTAGVFLVLAILVRLGQLAREREAERARLDQIEKDILDLKTVFVGLNDITSSKIAGIQEQVNEINYRD